MTKPKVPVPKVPTPKTPVPKVPAKSSKVPRAPVKLLTVEEVAEMDQHLDLPNALDLEEAIIGALLIDSRTHERTFSILFEEAFYSEVHQIIFSAMKTLYEVEKAQIDLLTVANQLKKTNELQKVGGDYHLVTLTQKVSSSAHIDFHSHIVLEKYMLRAFIANSSFVLSQAYANNPDVFTLMTAIESSLMEIQDKVINERKEGNSHDAVKELEAKMEARRRGEVVGLMTGHEEFDEWSGGFASRELTTMAARPGMGKTSVVLSICKVNSLHNSIPLALFSLEMAESDLKAKYAAGELNIPFKRIRKGEIEPYEFDRIKDYYKFIDNSPLHIVDRMTKYEAICRRIRELKIKHDIKGAIIDYVQLMQLSKPSSNRTQDLNTITRGLKALANELNIPIIILSQLDRSIDSRVGNKRPLLNDLKQSGSIEEDSDTVAFLLRPAYYQQKDSDVELPPETLMKGEFIIAKGRSIGVRNFSCKIDYININFT